MYFSKITLQKNLEVDKLTRIIHGDVYNFHQYIWQLFKSNGGERDFIYRRENQNWPCFYTLSQREPQYIDNIWDVKTTNFAPQLRVGQRLAFSLRVNPVRTKKKEINGKLRKTRCDVVMDIKKKYSQEKRPSLGHLMQEAGWEWLKPRMEHNGFTVNPKQLHVDSYYRHHFSKTDNIITFSSLDFNGILTVTQVDDFLTMLNSGIGPAKGFGCGMMLIRKV